jgi:RNA polymerase sigma-70 factor (ECF subfamily)
MPELEDQLIIDLFAIPEKRNEAFRLLMEKYQRRIYFHIRKMVIDHDDADDVTQNTFIKIYQGMEHFRGESQLFTWMYRIATNESLIFLNARKKRNSISIDESDIPLPAHNDHDPLMSGDKMERKLLRAIDTLPAKQKLVFNMRYFDNLKYEEISEILGTSVGALKASFFHAVNKIEKMLTED